MPQISEFVVHRYPPLARQARVDGEVTALLHLGEDGTVSSVTDVTGPSLLKGAADAFKEWRFDIERTTSRSVRVTMRFMLAGPEDVRNLTMTIRGKLSNNTVEITTNPTSEKPGPDVRP